MTRWMRLAPVCLVMLMLLLVPGASAQGPCAIFRSWNQGDTLTAPDLTSSFVTLGQTNMEPSCLDSHGDDATQLQTTTDPYPSGTVSLPATLKDELERMRFVLKKLSGWSQWYTHTEQLAVPNFNWTFNGDHEIWGAGTSAAPTGWVLTGAGATVAKNTTAGQFKIGTASVSLTRAGTNLALQQQIDIIPGYGPIGFWQNKTVTLGKWVRATVASRARISIGDGVGIDHSAYHTGSSTLEFLTVTRTIAGSATELKISAVVDTGDTTAQFDGAVLVRGSAVSDFIPSGWRGRKTILVFGDTAAQAQNTTLFYSPSGVLPGGGELGAVFMVPYKGVARRLHTYMNGTVGGSGQTAVVTLRKPFGGGDTALTASIASGETSGTNTSSEVEYPAGTAISMKVALSATAGSLTPHTASEYEEIP